MEKHENIELSDYNQINFKTSNAEALKFVTLVHNFETLNSYEEYINFDEKLDPMFNVNLSAFESNSSDKSLDVLNFVLDHIEDNQIVIEGNQINNDSIKSTVKLSKVESR